MAQLIKFEELSFWVKIAVIGGWICFLEMLAWLTYGLQRLIGG